MHETNDSPELINEKITKHSKNNDFHQYMFLLVHL